MKERKRNKKKCVKTKENNYKKKTPKRISNNIS